MTAWHIVTCEYPPAVGGVADYARLVADGLTAAGDEVHVWCPATAGIAGSDGGRARVHPVLGHAGPSDLRALDGGLDAVPGPRRLLVQWVPHGYGYRSMNVGFCAWVWRRARRGDTVDIMVHEPYLAFGEGSWRQDGAALVHRLMTMMLIRAASRVWVSIPTWAERWRPFSLGKHVSFEWLPIPSTLPSPSGDAVGHTRHRLAPAGPLVGHLGTYGAPIRQALTASLPALLAADPRATVALLGDGGPAFRDSLLQAHPALAARVVAPGRQPGSTLAEHVAACDVLVQPYPDGVSSRRTSAMAGLALGVPVVTNAGPMTEPVWAERQAVSMVDDAHGWVTAVTGLLDDAPARAQMAAHGRALYADRFDVARTIGALRHAR